MAQFQFNRSNILTPEERTTAGRKCLKILESSDSEDMSPTDRSFYNNQLVKAERVGWSPSERELAWLRDLVEKY